MSSATILWQVYGLWFLSGDIICLVSKSPQLNAKNPSYYLEQCWKCSACFFSTYFGSVWRHWAKVTNNMKSYNSIDVGIFNPLTLRLDWPIAYAFQLSEDLIPEQWTQNAFACQSFSMAQQSVWYILYSCNYSSQGIVKTQSFHFRQCLLPQGEQ